MVPLIQTSSKDWLGMSIPSQSRLIILSIVAGSKIIQSYINKYADQRSARLHLLAMKNKILNYLPIVPRSARGISIDAIGLLADVNIT